MSLTSRWRAYRRAREYDRLERDLSLARKLKIAYGPHIEGLSSRISTYVNIERLSPSEARYVLANWGWFVETARSLRD